MTVARRNAISPGTINAELIILYTGVRLYRMYTTISVDCATGLVYSEY